MKERVLLLGLDASAMAKITDFFRSKDVVVNHANDVKSAGWMLGSVPISMVIVDERYAVFLREIERRQQHVKRVIVIWPGASTHNAEAAINKPITTAELTEVLSVLTSSLGESTSMAETWQTAPTNRVAS